MKHNIKETLSFMPVKPGVYLMKGEKGEILYVGKAISLKSRVRSYFRLAAGHSPRISKMVSLIADIDFLVTKSEIEALVLESNLIKKYRPKFNVVFRDDKHYPYMKLTRETFPRLLLVRRVKKDGGIYFGPYQSSKTVSNTINLLNKLFKIRQCSDPLKGEFKRRPCLNFQMDLCAGACATKISVYEYQKKCNEALLFLRDKKKELLHLLAKEMEMAAQELRFEEAARCRDQLSAVKKFFEKQAASSVGLEDRDVIGLAKKDGSVVLQLIFVRSGKIIGTHSSLLDNMIDVEDEEIITCFISQYYSKDVFIPEEMILHLSLPIESQNCLSKWLSDKRGKKVSLHHPKRGERLNLLTIARENAETTLLCKQKSDNVSQIALQELKERLQLTKIPERIEGFDISTISGGLSAVGTMVVFIGGKKSKENYRRYRIRSVTGMDDYAMMREVLTRRLGAIDSDQNLPDLLIIDGGKGQIGVVQEVLEGLNISSIALIGIAKGKDRENPETDDIYISGTQSPVSFPTNSQGKYLLQVIRDEAHRFSVGYHRALRDKQGLTSALDSIPGVGAVRKKKLLKSFGSIRNIKVAEYTEIMKRLKVNKQTAERILDSLKE